MAKIIVGFTGIDMNVTKGDAVRADLSVIVQDHSAKADEIFHLFNLLSKYRFVLASDGKEDLTIELIPEPEEGK